MTTSTDSGDRPRLVKLCKKSGKWVLIGISAEAATGLSFASIPGAVADKVLSLGQTLGENGAHAESLHERVCQCNDLLNFIVQNLNEGNCHSTEFEENAISFLEDILDGFYRLLEAISLRCDKWSNNNVRKNLWRAKKFKEEFASLEDKLDTYMPILQSGVTVIACQKMVLSKEDVEKTKRDIEDMVRTLRQEFKEFAEVMIHSLQEFKDDSDERALEIGTAIRSLEARLKETSNNHLKNNSVAALEKRIEELKDLAQAAQSEGLEDEIKELKDLVRSQSWISSVINSSPSCSTALTGVHTYITVTSLITPEQENLTVTEVKLLVTQLTPGYAPTVLGVIITTAQLVTFLGLVLPVLVVILISERVFGEGFGDDVVGWTLAKSATLGFLCHCLVEATLSNGEVCTLERTTAVSDTAETCENRKSGVHLYWGINEARHRVCEYCKIVPIVNRSVKLSDLLIFCHRERRKQYDTWNNNCKHFCYNLLQKVFKAETELTFADFSLKYNTYVTSE
jgi:hypothetical protein